MVAWKWGAALLGAGVWLLCLYVDFAGGGVHLPTLQLGASSCGSQPAVPINLGRGEVPTRSLSPMCFSSYRELSPSLLLPAGGTWGDPWAPSHCCSPMETPTADAGCLLLRSPLKSQHRERGEPSPQLCGAAAQLTAGKLCFWGSCAPWTQALSACR